MGPSHCMLVLLHSWWVVGTVLVGMVVVGMAVGSPGVVGADSLGVVGVDTVIGGRRAVVHLGEPFQLPDQQVVGKDIPTCLLVFDLYLKQTHLRSNSASRLEFFGNWK